jgi:hypothetical protein
MTKARPSAPIPNTRKQLTDVLPEMHQQADLKRWTGSLFCRGKHEDMRGMATRLSAAMSELSCMPNNVEKLWKVCDQARKLAMSICQQAEFANSAH